MGEQVSEWMGRWKDGWMYGHGMDGWKDIRENGWWMVDGWIENRKKIHVVNPEKLLSLF
jgi:hypothetical protein